MRDLTFIEIVKCVGILKESYDLFLVSFFNSPSWARTVSIKDFRDIVYDLNLAEWKKDRIWECLNDDISFEELLNIAEHSY